MEKDGAAEKRDGEGVTAAEAAEAATPADDAAGAPNGSDGASDGAPDGAAPAAAAQGAAEEGEDDAPAEGAAGEAGGKDELRDMGLEDSDDDLGLDDSEDDEDGTAPAAGGAAASSGAGAVKAEEPLERKTVVDTPRIPGDVDPWVCKFPAEVLGTQARPFSAASHDKDWEMREMGAERLQQVIRWRYKTDQSGRSVGAKESNARIVKFKNGDTFLFVGKEAFRFQDTATLKQSTAHMTQTMSQDGGPVVLGMDRRVERMLKLVPTRSSAGSMVVSSKRGRAAKNLRVSERNVELEQDERAKREAKRLRDQEKEDKRRRMREERDSGRGRARSWKYDEWNQNFLEGDEYGQYDDDDEEEEMFASKKRSREDAEEEEEEEEEEDLLDEDEDEEDEVVMHKRAKKSQVFDDDEDEDEDDDA